MSPEAARSPEDPSRGRALLLCGAYAALMFASYCVWKYSLAERSADAAVFENCLWNATHGNGLRTWLEGGEHHLSIHFSPIMYLFVPLYALAPSMHVVHLVVCLATAAAGFALYVHARPRLGPGLATVVMLAFLFHPTVVLQTFMEFHEQALAFLPLVLVLLFHDRRALWPMIAAALVLLATREDNALFLIALAAYSLVTTRNFVFASVLAALGAAGWLLLYRVVGIGVLGGGEAPHFLAYEHWGATPGAALVNMLTHPLEVLRSVTSRPALSYLAQLLAPLLGLLPLGSALALVGLPNLMMVLLSNPALRIMQVRMHYSVVPVTVGYMAAVETLATLRRAASAGGAAGRRVPAWLPGALAGAMLVLSLATVPVWVKRAIGRLEPHPAQVRAALAMIPDTASVTAPGFLLNELAKRRGLDFTWGTHQHPTEYVLLENPRRKFYEGLSVELYDSPAVGDSLEALGMELIYARDDFRIWRRRGDQARAISR